MITHALIYSGGHVPGQRRRTALAIVEARDGDTLIVRKCSQEGRPIVKHGKRVTLDDIAATFKNGLPHPRDVRRVKEMTEPQS